MLRLLMLLLIFLCAQFAFESRLEHKVLSELSTFPNVYRIDDGFNRAFASITEFNLNNQIQVDIKNEAWRVNHYYPFHGAPKENLVIDTVVNSVNDHIALGKAKEIRLELVSFNRNKSLVLENKFSGEIIELSPIVSLNKKVVQEVQIINSSLKKIVNTQENAKGVVEKVNGIEVSNIELVFIQARIPSASKKMIYNNAINGRINLLDGGIDNGELVFSNLLRIGNNPIESIILNYIDVNNGGQISFDYMGEPVSGIFSKSGKDTYMMRVATGVLAGSSFTFARLGSEKMKEVKEKVLKSKIAQDQASKERSLAGQKALERSSYRF